MSYIYHKPKKKKTDVQIAIDKLDKWFSYFIRLRDCDKNGIGKCFTCGRLLHWKEADCGHGIGRQHKSTRYDERNCALQCKKCNAFEEGRKDVFAHNTDERWGKGTWDTLQVLSRKACHRGIVDYNYMAEYYFKEAYFMADQKGIVIK